MSKPIPGICSWCQEKKANRYGMCPNCRRFPSQKDYEEWDETDAKED